MSESKDKIDEPAFPVGQHDLSGGMSLRDWFAGQALAGMLSTRKEGYPKFHPKDDAEFCYQIANAMLAARKVT